MGSFNVACTVSSISINSGDPVAFIPLEIARFPYKIGDGNHMLIYSHCFYIPVTMPIFGKYNDYGGVEHIIRDENIEIVETYFDKKIKRIRNVDDFGKSVSSGMFVHKEIFECMARDMQVSEFGKYESQRAKKISNFFKYLEDIKKAKKTRDDYIKLREESKYLGRPFTRFGTMTKTTFTGTALAGLIKTKYTGLRGNQREIRTQPPFLHQNAKPNLKWLKRLDSIKKYFTNLENNLSSVYNIFRFRDYKTFNKIYQPVLYDYDPTKQDKGFFTALIDFAVFEDSLYATNNFYFPAMNGYQCGHKYASEVLYNKAKEIMLPDIADEIEREKEWERWRKERKAEKEKE